MALLIQMINYDLKIDSKIVLNKLSSMQKTNISQELL